MSQLEISAIPTGITHIKTDRGIVGFDKDERARGDGRQERLRVVGPGVPSLPPGL